MGAFVISKRFDDYYKFEFTSRKGKTIFTSLRYELKFECEEGIEYFKKAIDKATFINGKSGSGKFYFKIVIDEVHFATSRKYATELMLQKGILEIKKYAQSSEILDFSFNHFEFSFNEITSLDKKTFL